MAECPRNLEPRALEPILGQIWNFHLFYYFPFDDPQGKAPISVTMSAVPSDSLYLSDISLSSKELRAEV
jgi:hypothetical protein